MSGRDTQASDVSRRKFLLGVAGSVGASYIGSVNAEHEPLQPAGLLELEHDVIIIGAGAAGLSAALGVKREKPSASVLVLDAKPSTGGTSIRSGGRLWIPNNADMNAAGLSDPKDKCLQYMARMSYPDKYQPHAAYLGLKPRRYALLEAYYDQGAEMLNYYRSKNIMPWEAERASFYPGTNDSLGISGDLAPDYRPDYAENIPKRGRTVLPLQFDPTQFADLGLPFPNYGASLKGVDLILWLYFAALKAGVHFAQGVRVMDILTKTGLLSGRRVTGVTAQVQLDEIPLPLEKNLTAKQGVIFTSGGYSKNPSRLEQQFQNQRSFSGGGCAVTSAQGDLLDIASRHGLAVENMDSAWYVQNIYEQYRLDPDSTSSINYLVFQAYFLNGDSMIMVNRLGKRVANEKMNYHQRTQAHFQPGNRFLFNVFDQHCYENFVGLGGGITPAAQTLIGPADTVGQLTQQIEKRMAKYPETNSFGPAPDFKSGLAATISRFNDFARNGVDNDFHRGESSLDLWWHALCLYFNGFDTVIRHDCISANTDENGNPYPNPTMRPLKPPYWAVILSSGLQDTNGGPAIDANAQILDTSGKPVAGLYGAGNCIASPAAHGYWGAGGTLGPAVVFGHIAGRHAANNT